MGNYTSAYTSAQIDEAVGKSLAFDPSTKADKTDLAGIQATGSTNATGAAIPSGTYFYLDGVLVRAKADIAVGAAFTSGTNYEAVTAGGLNVLNNELVQAKITVGRAIEIQPGQTLNITEHEDHAHAAVLVAFSCAKKSAAGLYFAHIFNGSSGTETSITAIVAGANIVTTPSGNSVQFRNDIQVYTCTATILQVDGAVPSNLTYTVS